MEDKDQSFTDQLVRLGTTQPSLRPHIRPLLSRLASDQEDLLARLRSSKLVEQVEKWAKRKARELSKDYAAGVNVDVRVEGMKPRSTSHPLIDVSFQGADESGIFLNERYIINFDVASPDWAEVSFAKMDDMGRSYGEKDRELYDWDARKILTTLARLS